MNIIEAKALGEEELKRRIAMMREDIDSDPKELKTFTNALAELEFESQAEQVKAELEQETTKQIEERAQAQEQHINELMDFVINLGLFESTVGEQPVSGLGLNEYQERREQFNVILYLAIVEKQKELMTAHNDELQVKINTINELTVKYAGLETSLAKVVKERDDFEDENITLTNDNKKLEAENEELGKTNLTHLQRITELEGTVNQLRAALEQEKKSKPIAAPSKSLQEQIEEYKKVTASKWVKVKNKEKMDITGNQWRIVHLDDKIEVVNGIEQAKYRVATEDEIEEARFLAEQAAKDVGEESVESDPTLVVPIPEPTFHITLEDETHDAAGGLADGNVDGTVEDGAVEARSLEERVAALEQRVSFLEILKEGAA